MSNTNSDWMTLVDDVKDMVLGLATDSVEDVKTNWFALFSNLFVGAIAFVPSMIIAADGVSFAQQMTSSGTELTLMSFATMVGPLFIATFVSTVCYLGLVRVFIKMARGLDIKLLEVLSGYRKIWSLATAAMILSPAILLGMLLFVLPGLYLMMRASMIPVLIIDENMGPLVAMKKSFALTGDRNSDLVLLLAAFVLANYFMSAISLIAGSVLPALTPMIMVPFFLFSQYLVIKFHVCESSGAHVWGMLSKFQHTLNRA